jgi:hypothetical protein
MQENQQVVFLSDGGEDIRRLQEYLQPHSEPLIDWFPMRVTVLQQQTKALQEERPETGADVSKRLNSLKHLLRSVLFLSRSRLFGSNACGPSLGSTIAYLSRRVLQL